MKTTVAIATFNMTSVRMKEILAYMDKHKGRWSLVTVTDRVNGPGCNVQGPTQDVMLALGDVAEFGFDALESVRVYEKPFVAIISTAVEETL
jgi:hypothetical protein